MADAVYTHGHHDSVLRSHRWRTAENSAAYLLGDLTSGAAVLDVGCGPGTITADFAELVAPGRVVAIDTSEEVVAEAARVMADRGLTNVETAVEDVYALPYQDDTFDIVHAHQVLQHLGDPVAALREMRRVCKPGGIVAARDAGFDGMSWYPRPPAMDDWLRTYQKVARANGGEPNGASMLLTWARAAGLTDVTCTASAWCYTTPAEREWWGELWAERTLSSAYAERATSSGHATVADLRGFAEAWRSWSRADDAWFGILNGEIRCRV